MPSAIHSKNIKHPNTFSIVSGNTELVTTFEAINQSIRLILTTAKGELFGDPDFGCHLHRLQFEYVSSALDDTIKREIVETLSRYEPRIVIRENDINIELNEDHSLHIMITYSLKYTNYSHNYDHVIQIREAV